MAVKTPYDFDVFDLYTSKFYECLYMLHVTLFKCLVTLLGLWLASRFMKWPKSFAVRGIFCQIICLIVLVCVYGGRSHVHRKRNKGE